MKNPSEPSDPDDEPSDPIQEESEGENLDEVIDLADEIELPGFEEYEQTRKKLDIAQFGC